MLKGNIMVWLEYDWQKDRVAFWNLDQMRENLWHQVGQQRFYISPKHRMIYSQDLIIINDNIKNSIFNKTNVKCNSYLFC